VAKDGFVMPIDLGHKFGTLSHVVGSYTNGLATYWPGAYVDPGTTIYYNYWNGTVQYALSPAHPEWILADNGYPAPGPYPAPEAHIIMATSDSSYNHGVRCELNNYVNFPYPITVTSVGTQFSLGTGNQSSGVSTSATYTVYLYYSGAWNQIDTVTLSTLGWGYDAFTGATGSYGPNAPRIVTGNWTNVTAANIYTYVGGISQVIIYQIAINGVPFTDSGVRVKTPEGVVSIGAVPLNQSFYSIALRVKKSSGVVAIPLVGTSDVTASTIRMSRGGITYALGKLIN
jgi:hypothetical protein